MRFPTAKSIDQFPCFLGESIYARLALSFRAMTDRLYAVAERVIDEGSEVVGVIVRTEAGCAIVLATIS